MSGILKYFHAVKKKLDLPDPIGPLSKIVLSTAIAAANVKVTKTLNESEKHKQGPWNIFIFHISTEVQNRYKSMMPSEHGITATIHYYMKNPDLVLKESSAHGFKNT